MSGADKARFDDEPGFVLHNYPFRETSLIVEVFTRRHGRVALIARGARRPKSTVRGVLLAFQPLQLSWFGKSELRTLHRAEWQGGLPALQGMALMCGFYLNELLLRLLARDDPHEKLFEYYQTTLAVLAEGAEPAATLRRFEKRLLEELGYGLTLDREARTDRPVAPEGSYRYILEEGPVAAGERDDGVKLLGKTLLDMASDRYDDLVTRQQSKRLMRTLINHYLGDQPLHTRQLLKDLQDYD